MDLSRVSRLSMPAWVSGLLLISLLMHVHQLGVDITGMHAWRQIYTMANAINFYDEDMNILNPRIDNRGVSDGITRLEFPLLQWLIAAVWHVTGKSVLVARLMIMLIIGLTAAGIYRLAEQITLAAWAAKAASATFIFSPLIFYYFLAPFPDHLALMFSVFGMLFFSRYIRSKSLYHLLFSLVALMFAALVKLPFALFYIFPAAYILQQWLAGKWKSTWIPVAISLVTLIPPAAWYITVIPGWGANPVVRNTWTDATLFRIFDLVQHHVLSMFPEMLINYAALPAFIAAMVYFFRKKKWKNEGLWPVLAVVVMLMIFLLLELFAMGKKHDYYLLPFMAVIPLISGFGFSILLQSGNSLIRRIIIIFFILLPAFAFIRSWSRWQSTGIDPDLIQCRQEIRSIVPEDALVITGNDFTSTIWFYYTGRKGWAFTDDRLSEDYLKGLMGAGAEYLITNSQVVYRSDVLEPYFDEFHSCGNIRIIRLKKNE